MTAFHFRAVTTDDRPENGVIDANDAAQAAQQLMARGLYPLGITSQDNRLAVLLSKQIGNTPSTIEISQILGDLGHLLRAGIEIIPALTIMGDATPRRRIRSVLEHLLREVRTGSSLSTAMEQIPGFPAHAISVVRVGEVSGTLAEGVLRLAEGMRRAAALASQTRTALLYPSCIGLALIGAISVLVCVVVPTLEGIFSDGTSRLSWQAYSVVVVGRFTRDHALALLVSVFLSTVGLTFSLRNRAIRAALELFTLRIVGLAPLLRAMESARLAGMLTMLCSSALPLAAAVSLCQSGAKFVTTQNALATAALRVRSGETLHSALAAVPTLSPRMLALLGIGEATGRLAPLLDEAARDAERQVTTAVERLLALLTPALTLIFGAITGFVLYAVMSSILSINALAVSPVR